MTVSSRHILHQGPVIAAIGRSVVGAALRRVRKAKELPSLPGPALFDGSGPKGPELVHTVSPRPRDLVRDYIRHVGGDPEAYRGTVPPHFFPQWSFPIASRLLSQLPYPLERVLNAGCRVEMRAPLADDRTLTVRARLESIDDDGRRALVCTRIVTGTDEAPEALVAYLYALVPLGAKGKGKGEGKAKKEVALVPDDAERIASFSIAADAGLSFAKLTGDFNPVHWVPAYARAFGFSSCILQGFSTMARAIEGLNAHDLRVVDVKFTRPLVLPAEVGLYVAHAEGLYVGEAPGEPAHLVGRFERRHGDAA